MRDNDDDGDGNSDDVSTTTRARAWYVSTAENMSRKCTRCAHINAVAKRRAYGDFRVARHDIEFNECFSESVCFAMGVIVYELKFEDVLCFTLNYCAAF